MGESASVGDVVLRDPYEVLGVERGATAQEIKSACMPAFFYPRKMLHAFPALPCSIMHHSSLLCCKASAKAGAASTMSRHGRAACMLDGTMSDFSLAQRSLFSPATTVQISVLHVCFKYTLLMWLCRSQAGACLPPRQESGGAGGGSGRKIQGGVHSLRHPQRRRQACAL